VAPSTVRFYERAGLLSPPRRAANGYRLFDESALEEMAFIARAKRIGMSLEDISDLVAAWPAGECCPARLRMFLTGRIGQVHEQVAELGRFERQLRSVLDRLSAHDPGPERCGKGCICETDLDPHRPRDLRQRPSVTPLPPDGKERSAPGRGRARCVPDGAVEEGASRSLAVRPGHAMTGVGLVRTARRVHSQADSLRSSHSLTFALSRPDVQHHMEQLVRYRVGSSLCRKYGK
jgi:DNA-binding transcriptional MerR regulator